MGICLATHATHETEGVIVTTQLDIGKAASITNVLLYFSSHIHRDCSYHIEAER